MKALQIRDFGTVKNEEMGRLFIMENEAGIKGSRDGFRSGARESFGKG